MDLTSLQAFFATLGANPLLAKAAWLLPLVLVALDLGTGVASALRWNTFHFGTLPQFLNSSVGRYLVAFVFTMLVWLVAGNAAATAAAGLLTMGALAFSVVASIISNVKELLPAALAPFVDAEAVQIETQLHAATRGTAYEIPAMLAPLPGPVPAPVQPVTQPQPILFKQPSTQPSPYPSQF